MSWYNGSMDDLLRELALLREFGFTHLDLSRSSVLDPRSSVETGAAVTREIEVEALTGASEFEVIKAEALVCTKCRLAKTRTQVVWGTGDPNAALMFIGEAPGRDEDLKGEPFVGRAGQLLTDIIKAMKLSREQVYIANVIKCRPPENRNPEPDELEACRPYIQRQVALINPQVIVTLGKFALQSLTGRVNAVSAARGVWTEYNGIRVMPTYHPAYLLRTPSAKKDVWNDMKKVMTELGISA